MEIDGDYFLFDSIEIESLALDSSVDYSISKGSTIIDFTDEGLKKLNGLEAGTYSVSINYNKDEIVTQSLIIEEPNPKTANNMYIYLITLVVSSLVLISIVKYKRNFNKID